MLINAIEKFLNYLWLDPQLENVWIRIWSVRIQVLYKLELLHQAVDRYVTGGSRIQMYMYVSIILMIFVAIFLSEKLTKLVSLN